MKIKMRGLRDFKVPDFKFPKFKMKDISEIEEMNINYDEIEKNKDKKKDKKEFVATNYNSIKEIFEHSIKLIQKVNMKKYHMNNLEKM